MAQNNSDNKKAIIVPYDDFVCGLQALQILISARQILKSGDAYASKSLMAVLGVAIEEGAKDARTN